MKLEGKTTVPSSLGPRINARRSRGAVAYLCTGSKQMRNIPFRSTACAASTARGSCTMNTTAQLDSAWSARLLIKHCDGWRTGARRWATFENMKSSQRYERCDMCTGLPCSVSDMVRHIHSLQASRKVGKTRPRM